jgi:hypothetical protein
MNSITTGMRIFARVHVPVTGIPTADSYSRNEKKRKKTDKLRQQEERND